mmetsp:Transcript_25015/g.99441  ORF Transcript_25015/g.99441 Transcript_25015/m.99441 type:complete len:349 (-) Transcript_25015:23-1069(-)
MRASCSNWTDACGKSADRLRASNWLTSIICRSNWYRETSTYAPGGAVRTRRSRVAGPPQHTTTRGPSYPRRCPCRMCSCHWLSTPSFGATMSVSLRVSSSSVCATRTARRSSQPARHWTVLPRPISSAKMAVRVGPLDGSARSSWTKGVALSVSRMLDLTIRTGQASGTPATNLAPSNWCGRSSQWKSRIRSTVARNRSFSACVGLAASAQRNRSSCGVCGVRGARGTSLVSSSSLSEPDDEEEDDLEEMNRRRIRESGVASRGRFGRRAPLPEAAASEASSMTESESASAIASIVRGEAGAAPRPAAETAAAASSAAPPTMTASARRPRRPRRRAQRRALGAEAKPE